MYQTMNLLLPGDLLLLGDLVREKRTLDQRALDQTTAKKHLVVDDDWWKGIYQMTTPKKHLVVDDDWWKAIYQMTTPKKHLVVDDDWWKGMYQMTA
jgi:hypothetical protein